MTNTLFKAVDQAPFAGKFFIRDTVKSYVESPPSEEKKRFLGVNALLGVMVAGHALQAAEGAVFISSRLESFQDHGNPLDLAIAGFDGVYAVINTIVAARQAALVPRMNQIRVRRKNQRGEMTTSIIGGDEQSSEEEVVKHSETTALDAEREEAAMKRRAKAMGVAVAVTLSGQALFVGTALVETPDTTPPPPAPSTADSVSSSYQTLPLESGKVTIDLNDPSR